MQEILIEDQLRSQLHIQDPTREAQQQVQNRPNRPRKVKKLLPKADLADGQNLEETISALKSEIDFMPMKTPISILQVFQDNSDFKSSTIKILFPSSFNKKNISSLGIIIDINSCR